MKKPLITVNMWTERFLGSAQRLTTFLSMIETLDHGRWRPDKWSQFEPVKNDFTEDCKEDLRREWTEERHGRISNAMFFKKKKPGLFLNVTSWRGRVPDLNYLWFDMEASEFAGEGGSERLKRIVAEFILWSDAVYATAHHSDQLHYRSAPGNPTKRLDQLNWMTFLGAPYVRMFGRERITKCPFHSCEEVAGGLLVTSAERPDSPSMCASSEVLLDLEKCLGSESFASEDYPDVSCRVPTFDLSDTVNRVPVL